MALGEINRFPHGLLSAFDLKTQGETPRFLAPTVQVTFDGMPFYIADKEQSFSAIALAAAGTEGFPTVGTVTVPDQEIWYVRHFTAAIKGVLAANRYCCAPGLLTATRLAGSFYLGLVGDPVEITNAVAGQHCISRAQSPFWAYPGDQLGVYIALCQAANCDLEIRGLYVPFTR